MYAMTLGRIILSELCYTYSMYSMTLGPTIPERNKTNLRGEHRVYSPRRELDANVAQPLTHPPGPVPIDREVLIISARLAGLCRPDGDDNAVAHHAGRSVARAGGRRRLVLPRDDLCTRYRG